MEAALPCSMHERDEIHEILIGKTQRKIPLKRCRHI
jgi:hypothetical protein